MTTHVANAGHQTAVTVPPKFQLWNPSRPIVSERGKLYLADTVYSRLMLADDGRDAVRNAAIAAFDQFAEMGALVHRLFDDSWGRLGVAQMKVMAPKPGSRLIGAFIEDETYVGLRIYWRDELDFKATGQVGKIDYRTLGRKVATEWDALMPDIRRMPMKEFQDD